MNKYEIIYQENNKKLKKIIEVENELDLKLLPVNTILIKQISKQKIVFKDEVVINILNELNLILSSNINFNEALNILRNSRKDSESLEFISLIYKLVIEQKELNKSFEKVKINDTVKLFFNLIQKTGEINSNLSALNIILLEEKTLNSKFKNKISYPLFLFVSFLFSLVVIFSFVIPKFENLINIENSSIFTKSLFFTQYMFSNYLEYLFLVFMLISFAMFLFFRKNRKKLDKLLFKFLPFYKYYELYKFFLILEVFTKSKYEFYVAFSNSSYLIKNKYLLDKISLCNSLLHKGKSIAYSLQKAKIFDEITINLMNIAQQTNSIETIVSDIRNIYKQKFDNSFNIFISIIQPLFLIFMTILILWIVLGIFVPLWDVSNIISF